MNKPNNNRTARRNQWQTCKPNKKATKEQTTTKTCDDNQQEDANQSKKTQQITTKKPFGKKYAGPGHS